MPFDISTAKPVQPMRKFDITTAKPIESTKPMLGGDLLKPKETPISYLKETAGNVLPDLGRNIKGMADLAKNVVEYIPRKGAEIGIDLAKTFREQKSVIDPNRRWKMIGEKLIEPVKHPAQATERILTPANEMAKGLLGFGKDIATHPLKTFKEQPVSTTLMVAPFAPKALKVGGAAVEAVPKGMINTSSRIINSIIKPLKKDFSYGKNAGEGVVREGIIASSFDDLANKVSAKTQEIGRQISESVSNPKYNNKKIDASMVIENIDNAIMEAAKTPRTNASVIARLNKAKLDLLDAKSMPDGTIIYTKDMSKLSPTEAWNVKKSIGDITKFTGNISDDAIVNKALKRSYGTIKERMNKSIPELADLNERYANIKTADIAIKYRDKILQRQNLMSIVPKLSMYGGAGGALMTGNPAYAAGGIALAGLEKLAASTPVKTAAAQALYRSGRLLQKGISGVKKAGTSLNEPIPTGGIKKYLKNERGSIFPTEKKSLSDLFRENTVPLSRLPQKEFSVRTASGERKTIIPKPNEKFHITPYESEGKTKFSLHDGDTYQLPKNVAEDLINKFSMKKTGEFAPELKGVEEVVKGKETKLQKNILNELNDYQNKMLDKYGRDWFRNMDRQETEAHIKLVQNNDNAKIQPTKFSQYTEPGGENYREVLIKTGKNKNVDSQNKRMNDIEMELTEHPQYPESVKQELRNEYKNLADNIRKVNFTSSHWDEPNVIAHVRMNNRITPEGKKVLFLEEIQSDWAREARKEGSKAPQHELLKNWQELTLKRALKETVDRGDDYLSWTSGEQQAARYNLAKHIDDIKWVGFGDGRVVSIMTKGEGFIEVFLDKSGVVKDNMVGKNMPTQWQGKHLSDIIGKGIAEKVLAQQKGELSGEGLSIGGEWAKNLYDKQIPNILKDLTGGEIENIKIRQNPKLGKDLHIEETLDGNFGVWTTEELNAGGMPEVEFPSLSEARKFVSANKNEGFQKSLRITPEIRAMVKGMK